MVVGATRQHGLDLSALGGPVLSPGLGAQGATAADLARIFDGADLSWLLPAASRSILGAGPDPAATSAKSHPSRYGWLNTPGTTPTPLAEWDNPEALTLALARAGWTLPAGDELRPDPAERIALRPLPAEAWTCPPWCTACADTPALDLRADPATPLRAVLVHAQPLGTIATTAIPTRPPINASTIRSIPMPGSVGSAFFWT